VFGKPKPLGGLYLVEVYDPYALIKRDILGRLAPELKVRKGYVGQTRQKWQDRWDQHRYGKGGRYVCEPQVWADTWVRAYPIMKMRPISDYKLDVAEGLAMGKHKPLYPYLLNQNNPHQIPKWEAKRLREERDRLGGAAKLIAMAKANQRGRTWWGRLFKPEVVGTISMNQGRITEAEVPGFPRVRRTTRV
jgi:hypothetical protein